MRPNSVQEIQTIENLSHYKSILPIYCYSSNFSSCHSLHPEMLWCLSSQWKCHGYANWKFVINMSLILLMHHVTKDSDQFQFNANTVLRTFLTFINISNVSGGDTLLNSVIHKLNAASGLNQRMSHVLVLIFQYSKNWRYLKFTQTSKQSGKYFVPCSVTQWLSCYEFFWSS